MKRSEAQIRVQQFLDAHEKMASHGPDCIVALHIDNNNSVLLSSDLIALIKELEDAKINARPSIGRSIPIVHAPREI